MDYIVRGTAAEGYIRAFAASTRDLTEEARGIHKTSPVVTAAMGRLLTAGCMMGIMLKGEGDLLTLTIRGDGPMQGITVTADSKGRVKCFPYQSEVWIDPRPDGKLNVGGAVGRGTLTVVRDQGLKEPYSSQVELVSGEIGEDLTNYFAVSEQVPSSVGLGVLVDRDQSVKEAGGFIVQLMPGVSDEVLTALENNLKEVHSVTQLLENGLTPEQILEKILRGLQPEILETMPAEYHCNCSRERVGKVLLSIGAKELQSLIDEGKPAELNCNFCGKSYTFSVEEMKEILAAARQQRLRNIHVADSVTDSGRK